MAGYGLNLLRGNAAEMLDVLLHQLPAQADGLQAADLPGLGVNRILFIDLGGNELIADTFEFGLRHGFVAQALDLGQQGLLQFFDRVSLGGDPIQQ